MKLKTYRASSMAQALVEVKKDLGRDAVILHTRSVKVGGVLGFNKKTLIEITAADQPMPGAKRSVSLSPQPAAIASLIVTPAPAPQAGKQIKSTQAASSGHQASAGPARSPALNAYRKVGEMTGKPVVAAPTTVSAPSEMFSPAVPIRMQVRGRSRAGSGDMANPALNLPEAAPEAPPIALPGRTSYQNIELPPSIHKELADIKLLVNQVLHSSPTSSASVAAGAMPDALFKHYLRLLEASVARDIADGIIGAVRDELNPGELHDEAIVRTTVLRHLAGLIPVATSGLSVGANSNRGTKSGKPTVIALVGPTGVGKTTTIAKLAASYKLRQGRSVALITSDTYRIAAVDQLRTYAGIIGLPLRVVMTPAEMAQGVQALSDHEVILVDTAGRSPFNTSRLDELQDLLTAAGANEVHLVLSSAASENVLLKSAQAFAHLKPDRIILTKLDEAVNFGIIVNVAKRLRAQFSYVTTGQEVPDDIEPGHPDRLARLVLDNTGQQWHPAAGPMREGAMAEVVGV